MKTLTVELGERSYPIYIGEGALDAAGLITGHIRSKQVLIVTNKTIAPLYLETLQSKLSDFQVDTVILPDGEQYKNLETLNHIFDSLLSNKHNRSTTLIALGGGVVGDMTGFAASAYQRGVNFIQIPTTLLAQVDSSVGGKTAVNHPLGKNMIGAFYQPVAVVADTTTLSTLPEREFNAGMAEVIKYGLITDIGFLNWLETNTDKLRQRSPEALSQAIERSCQNKAKVVAEDEKESGVRAILNLGHTFGHAIETAQGYREWLHGEAVAAGMVMAADLSCRMGWISADDVERIRNLLQQHNLPVAAPANISAEKFMELMIVDKKVLDGRLRLVLLKALGQAVVTSDVKPELVMATLQNH